MQTTFSRYQNNLIRINDPRVNRSNDFNVKIVGVEITDKYTAIHMVLINIEADAYAYYV